jgi:RNA polymerase sigma-70 factor (ECF subfamily)
MTSAADAARAAAERSARDSYGRLVALLAARTRDLAGAEDALADAFAAALRRWPETGVPSNPDAWLLTAARRRQTDAARRRQTGVAGMDHLKQIADEIGSAETEKVALPDRRLALMFACAHPAIEPAQRTPLILQTMLGFSAAEIAAAFLTPPAAMSQRLVRAKTRIRQTGIPLRVPERDELTARLDAVLAAIYAAYARGWGELEETGSDGFADEAIWLGRLVVSLLPAEPEAKAMLALMLYAEGRRAARRDASGAYVPLEAQDTGRWDRGLLQAAETLLHEANGQAGTGRYQLEAAIQSAHVARRLTGRANWPAIVALYDHLLALTGSPVVLLNRAVALAETVGAGAALETLAPLTGDDRMASYQPYWAARGALLRRAGRQAEAREALTVAIGLSTDDAVRHYLLRQRDEPEG